MIRLRGIGLVLAGFLIFSSSPADAKKEKGGAGKTPSSSELYQELDLFSRVLQHIRHDYVEDPDERELIYGAIRGMLLTLDPHSIFMPRDVYRELKIDTEGRFGGVGIEITYKDGQLTVVTPIEGSPAERAGVREADRILKIDGLPTREMGISDAVRKMRGKRGSKVTLTLLRQGSREPFDITLTRETIRIKSVRFEMPEDGIGYVRITSFQEGTSNELKRSLSQLNKKSKSPLKGLVLDLRNNPGGLLDEAVSMSDIFLKSGVIVTTSSRNQEIDKRLANDDGTEPDYPIVALVNGGTASAAEIVAGALQDQGRAAILGTQTFGKGSVQTIFELDDGAALKLTVARYYTPKGRSIQAKGISPDIVVEAPKKEAAKTPEQVVREKDLKGHLESEKGESGPKPTVVTLPAGDEKVEDYQKKAAIDYLKSRTP